MRVTLLTRNIFSSFSDRFPMQSSLNLYKITEVQSASCIEDIELETRQIIVIKIVNTGNILKYVSSRYR